MTPQTASDDPRQHPAVRNYILVCLIALVVLLLALLQRDFGLWSLLPILVGSLALAARWRLAPLMLLVVLGGALYVSWVGRYGPRWYWRRDQYTVSGLVEDVILGAAVLTYVAANYRLQGLLKHIFPADTRLPLPKPKKKEGRPKHPAHSALRKFLNKSAGQGEPLVPPGTSDSQALLQRRSARLVSPAELVSLLVTVAVVVLFAEVGWVYLRLVEPQFELSPPVWRLVLLVWLFGLVLIVAGGVFAYVRWTRLTSLEATLYLQDTAWRETRKEQGRIHRWTVWARRRTERRKDQP